MRLLPSSTEITSVCARRYLCAWEPVVLTIREYSLKRNVVQGQKEPAEKTDTVEEDASAPMARPNIQMDEKKQLEAEAQDGGS